MNAFLRMYIHKSDMLVALKLHILITVADPYTAADASYLHLGLCLWLHTLGRSANLESRHFLVGVGVGEEIYDEEEGFEAVSVASPL